MNISEAARLTGLPAKTIRYYEAIGLVRPPRDANGYRAFRDRDLHALAFLGRARALGFSIEDCRALLALWADESRESARVRRLAEEHLARIDEKIAQLAAMRAALAALVEACAGDRRPDCPILAALGRAGGAAAAPGADPGARPGGASGGATRGAVSSPRAGRASGRTRGGRSARS